MDKVSETRETQPQQEKRVIALGEVFSPFDPKTNSIEDTRIRNVTPSKSRTDSGLFIQGMLKIDEDLTIPIDISAIDMRKRGRIVVKKKYVLTPFNPGLGYNISPEDFIPKERGDKLKSLESEMNKGVDLLKVPLGLQLDSPDKAGDLNKFSPQIIQQLKRLRLFVSAGEMRLESIPLQGDLEFGYLGFYSFYPIDTGSLANPPIPYMIQKPHPETLWVHLPNDPEKLKQIRMQFVLENEKSREDTG